MDVVIALNNPCIEWYRVHVTFAIISGIARSGTVLPVILLRSGSQGNMHDE